MSRGSRKPGNKPIEELTTYKPFNIRETMWEVWDIKEAKNEHYLNHHQQRGMFSGQIPSARQAAMQPAPPAYALPQ